MPLQCLDICPHCGDILWIEWGFTTPQSCMIQWWYNYAYNFERITDIDDIIGDDIE